MRRIFSSGTVKGINGFVKDAIIHSKAIEGVKGVIKSLDKLYWFVIALFTLIHLSMIFPNSSMIVSLMKYLSKQIMDEDLIAAIDGFSDLFAYLSLFIYVVAMIYSAPLARMDWKLKRCQENRKELVGKRALYARHHSNNIKLFFCYIKYYELIALILYCLKYFSSLQDQQPIPIDEAIKNAFESFGILWEGSIIYCFATVISAYLPYMFAWVYFAYNIYDFLKRVLYAGKNKNLSSAQEQEDEELIKRAEAVDEFLNVKKKSIEDANINSDYTEFSMRGKSDKYQVIKRGKQYIVNEQQ